ncbi:tumor necrosis factor receptor superfamily member 18 [Ctenodactylus gundi]
MGLLVALCGVLLPCLLSLGQRPSREPCGLGRFLRGSGTDERCCGSCAPGEVCTERDCECTQPEYHCGDPKCETCKHHPCPPGQEARPDGNFNFGFRCVDCAAGTFSRDSQGRCRPWSDCDQFGFLTVFPGNKTHNAACAPWPLPTGWPGPRVAALAAIFCILVLIAAQLGLHVWQLRRQDTWPRETQPLLEVRLPPPEDTCSCPFPEEERGGKLGEKDHLGDQWV